MSDNFKQEVHNESAEKLKQDEPSFQELMNKKKKKPYYFVENEADKSLDELAARTNRRL